MTETLEHTARQIAERGRDELVARLRPAFEQAANAHSDVLQIDSEQLEQMVQRAADRADGLQWRRALASVASEQLGIGMGEALSHPAVARAQAIVGAPSYEESLKKLKAGAKTARPERTEPGPRPQPESEAEPEPEAPEGERKAEPQATVEAEVLEAPEAEEAEEVEPKQEPEEPQPQEPEALQELQELQHLEPEALQEPQEEEEADGTLRIAAVHLGGIANLSPAESGIELRLSGAGLDIARGGSQVLGRLAWDDISDIQVPPARGMRRRRRAETHLVVRTAHGDASFQVPGLTGDELRHHLKPMVERYQRQS